MSEAFSALILYTKSRMFYGDILQTAPRLEINLQTCTLKFEMPYLKVTSGVGAFQI